MVLHTTDRRDDDHLKQGMTPDGMPRVAQQETMVLHTPAAEITERRALTSGADASDGVPGAGATGMTASRTVVRDVVAERHRRISQINQVLWFAVGCIEVLLTLRLALKLLGANPAADFTQAVYGITAPLMAPFTGIFPAAAFGTFEFEPASAVAMLVWFLAGLGIGRLVWILYGEPRDVM